MLQLGRFPRVRLGHMPTPLEPMQRLSAHLGGPKPWIKRTEAVLLDPVYSGKAMAGLIDLVRKGRFGKDENVVFVHTGGQAGLFAYEPTFAA